MSRSYDTRGEEPPEGSREPSARFGPLGSVDEDTVRRARRGDPVALDVVVRALAPYVGRICGAIAMDDKGDDAMQEAMLIIVRRLPSLREPAALRGWARRIAVRESLRVAGSARSIPVDPDALAIVPAVSDDATAVEVRAVLDSLEPYQRAVLVLRHLDGLAEAEMAELLDVAPGTIKSRLYRARAAFRSRWST